MQTLEATDTFSVTWPDPGMSALPWVADRMHYPTPIAPLAQPVVGGVRERVLQAPTIFVNGYQFSLPPAVPEPTPEVAANVTGVWNEEYSPRIRAFCNRVRATDYDGMSTPELVETFDRLAEESIDMFGLTLAVVMAFSGPTYALLEFLAQELGADGPLLSGTLLQGTRNESAAAGDAIAGLVELAAASSGLADAVRAGDLQAIRAAPGGDAFDASLQDFLTEYGWRAESWGSIHVPTWAEAPEVFLQLVSRYLDDPSGGLSASIGRSHDQRATALAEVESRLSPESLAKFRELLAAAESHVPVSEDRARWQLSLAGVLRVPALAVGRRLAAAGALAQPDDVFFLTWDEAKRAIVEPGEWARAAAARAREDLQRWTQLTPPPFLGALPDMSMIPTELLRQGRHFFGFGMPSFRDGVISGTAASRGTATGIARIIRTLDESEKLQPGDILVCVTTAPPWTALFAIASAVVTDTGGVISHSAICAREFGIPCVTATQVGTVLIRDGVTITVDGSAGTVTIHP